MTATPFAICSPRRACERCASCAVALGFMAYHGGSLEEMTDVIARAAAERSGASYYGVLQPPTQRRTSRRTRFARRVAHARRLPRHVEVVITIHGYGRTASGPRCCSAGRTAPSPTTSPATCAASARLHDRDRPRRACPKELRGLHATNPVNLPPQQGVQIELPPRSAAPAPSGRTGRARAWSRTPSRSSTAWSHAAAPGPPEHVHDGQGARRSICQLAGAAARRSPVAAADRAGGWGGPARTRSAAGCSNQPPQNAGRGTWSSAEGVAPSARPAARASRGRGSAATAATTTRPPASPRGRRGEVLVALLVGHPLDLADHPHLAVQLQPGEQHRRPAVGRQLLALRRVVVGEEREPTLVGAAHQQVARLRPTRRRRPCRARTRCGSTQPASLASAYQRCHCAIGSASTSATSSPAVS